MTECDHMLPRHGYLSQNFSATDQKLSKIILETSSLENNPPYIRVSVKSIIPFKGFIITAFDSNENGESPTIQQNSD